MNIIAKFELSYSKKFLFTIPDLENKFNYYYEPNDKVHKFDECQILYQEKESEILLFQDVLQEAVAPFFYMLEELNQNLLELPDNIKPGKIGYYYNLWSRLLQKKNNKIIDYSRFLLWENNFFNTFLCTQKGIAYIEIAKSKRKAKLGRSPCVVLENIEIQNIYLHG